MHPKYCMHKYKKGIYEGMVCGKRIDIKCDDKNGKYKCYKHISKTLYMSEKKKDLDHNVLCIGKTKYGIQIKPCGNKKWRNNLCRIHYMKEINKNNEIFVNEVKILSNINLKIYMDNKFDVLKDQIDELDIKFNNCICLDEKCYNKVDNEKDFCQYHIGVQQPILEYEVIDDESIYYVLDLINIEKELEYKKKDLLNESDKNIDIDRILKIIDDNIRENKLEINNFIKECDKINNYEYINKNIIDNNIINVFNKQNIYEVVTDIINNKTYININYLKKCLSEYNYKFELFKNEIENDFPRYYKYLKGYFEIMLEEFNNDIFRNMEIAKIKSVFL